MHSYKNFEFKELKENKSSRNPKIQTEEKVKSEVIDFTPQSISKNKNEKLSDQFINADPEKKTLKPSGKSFKLNQASRDGFDLDKKEEEILESNIQKLLDSKLALLEKDAVEKGYNDGLKLGQEKAFSEYQEQAQSRLTEFKKFLDEAEALKDQIIEKNEELVVEMIFRMVKMITLKEISLDKEYVKKLAITLIQKVGLKNSVKLKVSSVDLSKVKEASSELNASIDELRNISFEVSDEVAPGGIILETDKTLIDAEIETQLKLLSESLFK